jgi:transposase
MPFRAYDQHKRFLLPPSLDEWIEKEHPARILSELVDRLEVSCLRVPKETGRPAYHPGMLLKVVLWGYAMGVRASRKIEEKLHSDIVFMWLAGMERPNFRTICLFRRANVGAIEDLFVQVVKVAREAGMGRLGVVAIDGMKMGAHAGYGSFKGEEEWRKEVKRLKERVREILAEAEAQDRADDERYGSNKRGDELPVGLRDAKERIRKIEEAMKRLKERGDEGVKVSMTDEDARLMHRKCGVIPAYNVQAAVTEDQIIVYAEVTREPVDVNQLLPGLDGIEERCGEMPEKVVADAGYGGGENLRGLEERGVDGYIPETEERSIGKKKVRDPGLYKKEAFAYDEEKDCYRCPAGEVLRRTKKQRIETKYSKREVIVYRAERGVCLKCVKKAECTKTEGELGRAVTRDGYERERGRMREKLKTVIGKEVYGRRKCIVEPVFGQIRVVEGFVQFLLRGLERVRVEWKWAAIVHNLLKIIRRVQAGEVRLGGARA